MRLSEIGPFHFDAYKKRAPLGAQDVFIKTLTQSFRAFVRLFSCFQWIYSIFFARERGQMETRPLTLAMGALGRNFGGTGTKSFLRTI